MQIPAARRPLTIDCTRMLNYSACLLALGWLALIVTTLTPQIDDFKQYWQAAVNIRATGDAYATTPRPVPYPYPPLLAYLIQPLSLLPQLIAQQIWFALNVALLGAFAAISFGLTKPAIVRDYWGVALLLLVILPPTRLSLQLGQVSILLSLLLSMGFSQARRKPALVGSLLAVAGLIKLYPLFLAGFYAVERRRSLVWWTAVGGAIGLIGSIAWHGLTPFRTYIDRVLLSGYYPYEAQFNISLLGFWRRLLHTSAYTAPIAHAPTIALALTAVSALTVVAVCVAVSLRRADNETATLRWSVWLCGMLLLSPINGYYNLVLLILPLLAAIRALEDRPDRRITTWLVLATLLICVPPTWSNLSPALISATHRGWGILLLTPSIYGLAIMFGVLALLSRRSQPPGALHGTL